MMFELYSKNKKILFAVFALVLLAGISYLAVIKFSDSSEPVFCTMEARLCSDGSYVGRTGPKCEFAKCPEIKVEAGWKIFNNSAQGISFQYPDSFQTTYMRALDWPPQVQIINESFECVEAGSEIDRAGRTEKHVISGREYCVTKKTEGAAGSIYTQYAYALPRGDKVIIFTFSIRATQCGNYPEPQKIECENERASFNIDSLIDRVAQTFRLTN